MSEKCPELFFIEREYLLDPLLLKKIFLKAILSLRLKKIIKYN